MLAIIGGRRSSCIFPGHIFPPDDTPATKDAGRDVVVVDFGNSKLVDEFMQNQPQGEGRTLLVEHAYIGLDGRMALSKRCKSLTHLIMNYREFGYANVILLTREVSWIRKMIRDVADIKFDFAG